MTAGATNPARVARSVWLVALLGLGLVLSACGGDIQVALPLGGGGPGVEYIIGNNTPAGGSLGFGAHSLGGQPVTVPADTNLLRLGLITIGGTANHQMAVYTDAAGVPGTLVIASISMAMVNGAQEVAVSPTVLLAGTYWIMFVMDGITNIGDTGSSTAYRYVNHAYGSALPTAIASSLNGPPHDLNIWMVVQD